MRSMKSRIRAAITAGFAISAVGLLAITGGTVAQLTDTIDAKVGLGVEAIPYGIARTVSFGFDYTNTSNKTTARSFSASVDSRNSTRENAPAETQRQYSYTDSGIRMHRIVNDVGCASSSLNNNVDRCLWTEPGSLVSASTGQEPDNGDFEVDFQDDNLHSTLFDVEFSIHDIRTSVSCHPNGTVSAAAPHAWYWSGGKGTSSKNSDWRSFPGENQYERIRQWMRNLAGQNQAMTIEVQSIRQTFSSPPRALSAIVMYATSSKASNGGDIKGDFAFVSKSECAVSPDGTVTLNPSTTFGKLIPDTRRLPTPSWDSNKKFTYVLASGDISTTNLSTYSEAPSREAVSSRAAADHIELVESGRLQVEDPLNGADPSTVNYEGSSPSAPTTASSSPAVVGTTTVRTSPTPSATQTISSGGPTPNSSTATSEPVAGEYTTATGQRYSSATGAPFTRREQELVEEAIAAAQDAESGELAEGATFATTSNQLDGTTLIITTADGGTLRIVWEE